MSKGGASPNTQFRNWIAMFFDCTWMSGAIVIRAPTQSISKKSSNIHPKNFNSDTQNQVEGATPLYAGIR